MKWGKIRLLLRVSLILLFLPIGFYLLLTVAWSGLAVFGFMEGSSQVRSQVEAYVRRSEVIRSDIGEINQIIHNHGYRDRHYYWMDYSGEVFVKVVGSSGEGVLSLQIAGNNDKEINSFQGKWTFVEKTVPLDDTGQVDKFMIAYERHHTTKPAFEKALQTHDCKKLLELIETNEAERKSGRDLDFPYQEKTLAKAKCFHEAGSLDHAAQAYGLYSGYIRPHWFRETPQDIEKIDQSQKYLELALKLGTDERYLKSWKLQMKALKIQRDLASNPCDDRLRTRLRMALEESRVHYKILPPCTH